ncbi:FAD-dependent oxidoreductase [Chelativorans sp. AA-79]|uniref:NAD(P)/FAD-dependent oxidoreductase n=1 Tax=Chelativorans sp. AA-79 TaxID=3028735 RepID=UPI0023F68971|nr:FAD-dependent oxidoreductase [Chelativorans sp. AA-79]WEX08272.1 FAD-dependent oxidoreductase [Chelativorans sp. AA-79]
MSAAVASRHSADLLVIGGGIHGCSAALHAALRGMSVIVLERDTVARHASGVNAGGVRRLGRDHAEIALADYSMRIWRCIDELVEDDCGFQVVPQIKVAENEADLEKLKLRMLGVRAHGFAHEVMLTEGELRTYLPAAASHCIGALAVLDDGFAQPFATTTAFRRRAASLGVRFHEHCAVREIRQTRAGWKVMAGGERFLADRVLNCAGAWAGGIAAMMGDQAPVEAIAPMMIVTARMPHFCDAVVGTASRPLSFKQMPNGTVIIGGARLGRADPARNRADLTMAELRHSAATAISVFPIMRHAAVVRCWSGVEGRMPDGIPVIGRSAVSETAFHAFGFSAHGFQLGPGVGALMAQLIATEECALPLDAFRIDRFAH